MIPFVSHRIASAGESQQKEERRSRAQGMSDEKTRGERTQI